MRNDPRPEDTILLQDDEQPEPHTEQNFKNRG